jgi:membrane associated rhomboid family serine protease
MLHNRDYMRSDGYQPGWPLWGRLIFALVVIFVLQTALEFQSAIRKASWFTTYMEWFALSLDGLKSGRIWQPFTFQFMHGGLWHLLGNSIIIFFFGRHVESNFGRKTFIRLYLVGGVIGGLVQIALGIVSPRFFGMPVIGASAGAFALLTGFCFLDLRNKITLLIFLFPVTIPCWLLIAFQSLVIAVGILAPSPNDIVAHGAHLGGLITGYLWVRYFVRGNGWSSIPVLGRFSPPQIVVKRSPGRAGATTAKRSSGGIRVVREENLDDIPDSEFISRKVDPILEKIRDQGIHSLTEKERKILERAQNKLSGK